MATRRWSRLLLCLACCARVPAADQQIDGRTMDEWIALMNAKPASHTAVRTLGQFGEPAIPALIKAMRSHPDGAIRFLSQLALAEVGRPAVPELDRVMQDGDVTARTQAVLALEKILVAEARSRLEQAAKDASAKVRARAHGALLRLDIDPQVHLQAMLELLLDKDVSVQWITAESLGWCGPKAAGAEAALDTALAGPARNVADAALVALRRLGTEAAMTRVSIEMAKRLADPKLSRKDALAALVEVAHAGPQAKACVPVLQEFSRDTSRDILVRGYAAWAADTIDPRQADEPGLTYHVAAEDPQADDGNAGTADQPFKSIQHAAEVARAGDTVLVHHGLYRECVRPFRGGLPDRPITYAAAPGERPVLRGSDLWQPDWRDEGDGLWSAPYQRHPWDHPEQWAKPKQGPMHRAEQVFVDGKLLVHVATEAEFKARAGSMFTDDETPRLWIHPEPGPAPGQRLVERSMRQQVFAPCVRGLGYLVVRGLTMRHAAAPESNGANWGSVGHRAMLSTRCGHHWLLEDNTVEWGNAQGIDIGGEGWGSDLADQPIVTEECGHHILRRNRVNYQGVAGIVGWGLDREQHLLLEDNVTDYNTRKGNFYQYETAGVKLHMAKHCIIRRHTSRHNESFGIWLDHECADNRITQCILTDNRAAGLFFEVSPGPLLADNNVILRTRDATRGNWADGIYSHDGNDATYANNFIADCLGYGVRVRYLAGRNWRGQTPTSAHRTRVYDNFMVDNARGGVSLHPETPRATDSRSDQNLFWATDGAPRMQLENPGNNVLKWQDVAAGRALGRSGTTGNLDLPFDLWQTAAGCDRHSLLVPRDLLVSTDDPEQLRALLLKLWPSDAPALDAGFAPYEPQPATRLLAQLDPELAGYLPVRTIALGPGAGLQVWQGPGGLRLASWSPGQSTTLEKLTLEALTREPADGIVGATLAAGDRLELPVPAGAKLVASGLPAELRAGKLVVSSKPDTPAGEYASVVAGETTWQRLAVQVGEALQLARLAAAPGAAAVSLANQRRQAIEVKCSVRLGLATAEKTITLPPQQTTEILLPVAVDGVATTQLTVTAPGVTLTREAVLSFATATRAASFAALTRYPLDNFPGGAFPEGVEAFALYQGGFGASWAARYDDQALHFRVEVRDTQHVQTQPPEALWQQDSVQLLLFPDGADSPLEFDVALPSEGGGPVVFRRQSVDAKRFPTGVVKDLPATVTRHEQQTDYEVTVPWAVLALTGPPAPGRPVRFSLVVNNDGGATGRMGLQWFFGIHGYRGDYDRLGTLWLK